LLDFSAKSVRPKEFETCPDWGAKFAIHVQSHLGSSKTAFSLPTVGTFVGMLFHNEA